MAQRIALCAAAAVVACAAAARAQCPDLQDGFEAYADGSGVAGQGAWTLWCDGGADALVSGEFARSGARSLRIGTDDGISTHLWLEPGWATPTAGSTGVVQIWTYIPWSAGGTGAMEGVVSLLTQECDDSADPERLTETRFSRSESVVRALDGSTLPLVLDRWVLYEVRFDSSAGHLSAWEIYDGRTLAYAGLLDSVMLRGAAIRSDGLTSMYLDDVRIGDVSSCLADINCDGFYRTGTDFIAMRNYYVSGDTFRADFDGNGVLTLNDFVQFWNISSCP